MAARASWIALVLLLLPAVAAAAARDSTSVADSVHVVRSFPPIEVRGSLGDLRTSQTVRTIPAATLHALPVDGLVEAVALQAGVVEQAGELHVRGGRTGETVQYLDGIGISEPLRRRMLELPLLALREVELVTGVPEAQFGCGLAGALMLQTVDPAPRAAGEVRFLAGLDHKRHDDRLGTRVDLPVGPLGVVAVADVDRDDTSQPSRRAGSPFAVPGLGRSLARRTENLLQGWIKPAPLAAPRALQAQVLSSRRVRQPWDPAWSLDGWVGPGGAFSDSAKPGYARYRAADHAAVTEERQTAAILSTAGALGRLRASAALGWLRTRSTLSPEGARRDPDARLGVGYGSDPFRVTSGAYPLYRESDSDALTLRGDVERGGRGGQRLAAGAGWTYEDVRLREMDWTVPEFWGSTLFERSRAYHAWAPGGYGYAQGRWGTGALVLNAGLRAEYWTPGPAGRSQSLPWNGRGSVLLSPRLGLAYPLSPRDGVSFSYSHVSQAPARDLLYDRRSAITNRQPLGNPALEPETVVSYEAAFQHLFDCALAVQASVFQRELYDQIGARDYAAPGLPINLQYDNSGNGTAVGFEWVASWTAGARRIEAQYTFMTARGYESMPEGERLGGLRQARIGETGDAPLSWDRRHTVALRASVPWRWVALEWTTRIGSPLPWTPHALTDTIPDPALINSRRLTWTECSNLGLRVRPLARWGLELGCEVRNLFDTRGERTATIDGYPNPLINTRYDEYGAYRTATGEGGGAYWDGSRWIPVHDPRLTDPPRSVRLSVDAGW